MIRGISLGKPARSPLTATPRTLLTEKPPPLVPVPTGTPWPGASAPTPLLNLIKSLDCFDADLRPAGLGRSESDAHRSPSSLEDGVRNGYAVTLESSWSLMSTSSHAPPVRETVLLVHGTWANIASDTLAWWQAGSDFCSRMNRALENNGCSARCWADVGFVLTDRPQVFAWTGANRESDRIAAGHALADTLLWFERASIRYHLVAHSHGGNVVLRALEDLPRDPENLGAVIFLGTPFLDFGEQRELKLLFTRRFPLAMHMLAFGSSCWLLIASRFHLLALGCLTVTGLAALSEAVRLFLKNPLEKKKRNSLYGSGRPFSFAFASDEAVGGLIQTVKTMEQPQKFVAQFMEHGATRGIAVAPARSYSQYMFKDTWPMLTLKGFNWKGPSSGARSPLLLPLRILTALVAIFALIPESMIFIANRLPRAWSLVRSKISRWLLEGPGAIVAGRVIRDSSVGADQGRLMGISHLPPEVQQLEPISAELDDRMSAVARQFTGAVGEAFHATLTLAPGDELKRNVLAHLSEPTLAHSQYYREQEIIEKTAARIAEASRAEADT